MSDKKITTRNFALGVEEHKLDKIEREISINSQQPVASKPTTPPPPKPKG